MFVIIELILAMNFRSLRYSILEAPPHKWLLIAIVWELALLAVLLQFDAVREAFGINMPQWSDVGFVLAAGIRHHGDASRSSSWRCAGAGARFDPA